MEAVGLLIAAPIFGYLSDRIANRRGPLLWGITMLAAAHIMLCLARTLPLLIIGRLLQGISAGAVWCVGLALVADTVEPENVGQMMGYVTSSYSVAALLAPLLGGIIYDRLGYHSVFGVGASLIILDIFFRALLIEKRTAKRWMSATSPNPNVESQDIEVDDASYLRQLKPAKVRYGETYSLSVNSHQMSTSTGQTTIVRSLNSQYSSGSTLLPLSINKTKSKPVFLVLLNSRRMMATLLANIVIAMILTGFDVTLPLFVGTTFEWGAFGAGLIFLAPLSPSFIQPAYGWVIDKCGSKGPAFLGMSITFAPYWFLNCVTQNSMSHKILLCALLFIIGTCSALVLSAVMVEFAQIAKEHEQTQPGSMGRCGAYAQSYSLFNVSWAIGSLVGSYFAGEISQRAGWGVMCWSYAFLCAVVSIPTLMYCGEWPRKRDISRPTAEWESDSDPRRA